MSTETGSQRVTVRQTGALGSRSRTSSFGARNVIGFLRWPLPLLQRLTEDHGDVVDIPMMGKPWLLLNHPDDIETFLVTHAASLVRDEFAVFLRRVLGEGLLTSDGELWKRQRRLSATAFTPKRIRGYASAMSDVTDRGLRRVRSGETVRLHREMSRLTMEVVAEVLFGAGITDQDVKVVGRSLAVMNDLLATSPEVVFRLPTWLPTPGNRAAAHAMKELDAIIFRIIDARRKSSEVRDDLLGALLSAVDEDGTRMDDKQLRDELLTLFLAGHETTSLALTHVFYLLGKHPEIERRLHAELESVLGGRLPTQEDVPKLVYADRVVKEAMRLYPPAWVTGREVAKTIEAFGRTVPVKTQVLVSQWIVHRDPRWWPSPEAFDPDRFLPEVVKTRPRFAYFPFGGGPRVCIGNHFAMMEAVLMLAIIATRFRVELLPFEELTFAPSVTLQPKNGGIRARFVARPPKSVAVAASLVT
jgi:cytochrome P450